jgi:hypothetical protein
LDLSFNDSGRTKRKMTRAVTKNMDTGPTAGRYEYDASKEALPILKEINRKGRR